MNVTEEAVSSVALALNVFPQLEVRYSDGYRAAKAIVGFGNLVKILGAVAGIIIAVGALIVSSGSGLVFFGGAVLGGLAWLLLFVGGVVICAQGQLLLATLDSAVNTSPFLDNPQRASIMSLSASSTVYVAAGKSMQGTGIRCRKCNSPSVFSISPKDIRCKDCGFQWRPLEDLEKLL